MSSEIHSTLRWPDLPEICAIIAPLPGGAQTTVVRVRGEIVLQALLLPDGIIAPLACKRIESCWNGALLAFGRVAVLHLARWRIAAGPSHDISCAVPASGIRHTCEPRGKYRGHVFATAAGEFAQLALRPDPVMPVAAIAFSRPEPSAELLLAVSRTLFSGA